MIAILVSAFADLTLLLAQSRYLMREIAKTVQEWRTLNQVLGERKNLDDEPPDHVLPSSMNSPHAPIDDADRR